MKVLVLGGTGFIGRRLVNNLISSGKDVTLATSGISPNPFGDRVFMLVADRFSKESMNNAFSGDNYFDVVFDTVGYRSLDLRNSLEALNRKCGKYVYISSAAVLQVSFLFKLFHVFKGSFPAHSFWHTLIFSINKLYFPHFRLSASRELRRSSDLYPTVSNTTSK